MNKLKFRGNEWFYQLFVSNCDGLAANTRSFANSSPNFYTNEQDFTRPYEDPFFSSSSRRSAASPGTMGCINISNLHNIGQRFLGWKALTDSFFTLSRLVFVLIRPRSSAVYRDRYGFPPPYWKRKLNGKPTSNGSASSISSTSSWVNLMARASMLPFKCSIFRPPTIGNTYGALCMTYARAMLVMRVFFFLASSSSFFVTRMYLSSCLLILRPSLWGSLYSSGILNIPRPKFDVNVGVFGLECESNRCETYQELPMARCPCLRLRTWELYRARSREKQRTNGPDTQRIV